MVDTLQVDGLDCIPGYDTYHTCRILSHQTAFHHALFDVLVLDGGGGKTMNDLWRGITNYPPTHQNGYMHAQQDQPQNRHGPHTAANLKSAVTHTQILLYYSTLVQTNATLLQSFPIKMYMPKSCTCLTYMLIFCSTVSVRRGQFLEIREVSTWYSEPHQKAGF